MVWTVVEVEEMVAFRLWSCSSTLVLLERGLEGTLADLRWQAMLGNGMGQATKPLLAGGWKRSQAAAMVSSQLWVPSLYRDIS